jgi:putative phage-type endonuclease
MNKFNIIEVEQGTQEWLDFRKGKIGSSDVSAIMGVSPFETKLQCWERMMRGTSKEKTHAMQRGSDLESKAREILNRMTGRDYQPKVLQSLAHPDLIASLDGFWVDENGDLYIAEIKCPGKRDHATAMKGEIPEHYVAQVAHQWDLSGACHVVYFSWDGVSEDGVIVEYEKDQDYADNMFHEVLSFFASMIDFSPPEATIRDWTHIIDLSLSLKAKEAFEVGEQIKALERKYKSLKDEIIGKCPHERSIISGIPGEEYKLKKVKKLGNLDYKKMMEDYGITNQEAYRKTPIEQWFLSQ